MRENNLKHGLPGWLVAVGASTLMSAPGIAGTSMDDVFDFKSCKKQNPKLIHCKAKSNDQKKTDPASPDSDSELGPGLSLSREKKDKDCYDYPGRMTANWFDEGVKRNCFAYFTLACITNAAHDASAVNSGGGWQDPGSERWVLAAGSLVCSDNLLDSSAGLVAGGVGAAEGASGGSGGIGGLGLTELGTASASALDPCTSNYVKANPTPCIHTPRGGRTQPTKPDGTFDPAGRPRAAALPSVVLQGSDLGQLVRESLNNAANLSGGAATAAYRAFKETGGNGGRGNTESNGPADAEKHLHDPGTLANTDSQNSAATNGNRSLASSAAEAGETTLSRSNSPGEGGDNHNIANGNAPDLHSQSGGASTVANLGAGHTPQSEKAVIRRIRKGRRSRLSANATTESPKSPAVSSGEASINDDQDELEAADGSGQSLFDLVHRGYRKTRRELNIIE